jgi:hypothetical protein
MRLHTPPLFLFFVTVIRWTKSFFFLYIIVLGDTEATIGNTGAAGTKVCDDGCCQREYLDSLFSSACIAFNHEIESSLNPWMMMGHPANSGPAQTFNGNQ